MPFVFCFIFYFIKIDNNEHQKQKHFGVPLLYLIELVGEWTPCGGYDLWGEKV